MAFKRRLRFDKRIKHKKKMSILYILLFVVIAGLGTGYAYIHSDLNINGTANVTAASWDVHFENLQVTSGSVTATTPASITDDTEVEFAATLDEPNDFYEFTVDVVNDGTMNAMIDNFSISPTLTQAQSNYLEYTITYSDGIALANKQELLAGSTENLKVRFSYIENSDKTNYPTEDQTFTIEFSVDYTQADNTAIEVPHPEYTYTANLYNGEGSIYIGQAMPNNITQYTSASDALAALRLATSNNNINFYLKHIVSEGIVEESYVEFVVTSTMAQANTGMTAGTYALRGFETYDENASSTNYCKAEYYTGGYCMNPYYESNKATLLSAFGSSNCGTESDGGNYKYLYCSVSGLYASANSDGYVNAGDDSWSCYVVNAGISSCGGEVG